MTQKIKYVLLAAIFLGGFSSMSLELIAMRQLSGFVGSTAVTASIIIGCFMAFMSIGYYHGSVASLRLTSVRRQTAQSFIIISLFIVLASSHVLIDAYFLLMNAAGVESIVGQTSLYSLLFLSCGPYLFGRITAQLSRYLNRYNRNYTGRIMAVDTVGSVLGSILTTLVIMPFIGVNHTIIALTFVTLLGAVILARNPNYLIAAFILVTAFMFNRDSLLRNLYNIVENNAISTVSILPEDDGKSKVLVINGGRSSKVSSDDDLRFNYVKFVEDNFLRTIPEHETKDILIIGAGGFTMGLKDKRNNYVFVDIDKTLLPLSEKYFLPEKMSANKKFIVADANQFLKESKLKYDLIILDTYSSRNLIPFDLTTREYFTRAKNNLKEGGVLVMNIVVPANFNSSLAQHMDNTIRSVFTHNLQRQVVGNFDAWCRKDCHKNNVMYVYYNYENSGDIYTVNKNKVFYDN